MNDMVGDCLPLTASCLRGSWARVGGGWGGALIPGLSHWVCRVNPRAGPSVVLLPSDVTPQALAAAAAAERHGKGAGLVWQGHLLSSVM